PHRVGAAVVDFGKGVVRCIAHPRRNQLCRVYSPISLSLVAVGVIIGHQPGKFGGFIALITAGIVALITKPASSTAGSDLPDVSSTCAWLTPWMCQASTKCWRRA